MSSTSRTRHVDPAAGRPSTQTPRSSGIKTPRSSTKRGGSKGQGDEGDELIVTRGLQELLNAEMQAKRTAPTGRPSKKRRPPGQAPSFVFCYLCGRQFGKLSIDIHRPQCYLKKMIQWERGDPATRGPKPVDPETHEQRVQAQLQSQNAMDGAPVGRSGGGGAGCRGTNNAKDIEAYNMVQMDAYNKESLSPCPNCGRTFLPDRLQIHLRSCKPGHTAKPIRSAAATSTSTPGSPASPATAASPAARGAAAPASASAKARAPTAAAPAPAAPSMGTEDQPIRASGSYAVPEGADIDAVPPGSTTRSGSTPNTAAAAAAARRSVPRRVSIIEPSEDVARPIDSDADSEDDVQFTEEAPTSGMASERRLSMSAEREALNESSTPYRPADMAPALSDSNMDSSTDRAPAAMVVESEGTQTPVGLSGGASPASATRRVGTPPSTRRTAQAAPAAAPATAPWDDGDEDGGEAGTPRKKIALNNVSRFKNVQSKLKQQMAQQAETSRLAPCQYCGRTFDPERVAKHESVCAERNKMPTPAARKPKTVVKKPAFLGNAMPASAPAASGPAAAKSAAPAASTGAPRFCDQCGTKLGAAGQKFCGSCGSKLQ